MPWCENEVCGKQNLKKEEIIFDELHRRILCVPCAQEAVASGENLDEVNEKTWFGIGYSTDQGLKAELIHGGAKFALKVDNDQIKRMLGT